MPTDNLSMLLMIAGIILGLCLLPAVLILLVQALPIIVAIVVALWVYHQVL